MIESIRFENVNGSSCTFNDDETPFSTFTTEVDVRFNERVRVESHGIYGSPTYLGKRLFHAEGDIMEQSSAAYMAKRLEMIAAVLPRPHLGYSESGTLFVEYAGISEELSCAATIDGWPELPMESMYPSRGRYQINWKTFDPRLYGTDRVSELRASTAATGRSYPKEYPKEYVGTGAPSDALITNSGNIETYPVITVYGPVTTIQLIRMNGSDLQTVKLQDIGLTGPGENVTVDFARRTAIKNDGTDVYGTITNAEWWAIEPGDNTIRYRGSGIDPPSKAVVTYQNAYMI